MANEWQSLLPSAWKPQDPNTQVQAAKTGTDMALTQAQAGVQAVDAVARNQDRQRKLQVQEFLRGSLRETIDPSTGKIVKVFDPARMRESLQKYPTQEGYELYAKMYPQAAAEATNRALSGAITDEGGYDVRKIASGAQRAGELGAGALNAGMTQQTQQLGAAEKQAGSKAALGVLATSPEGAAAPGTLVGNEQMQARQFGAGTLGPDAYKVDAKMIAELPSDAKRAAILNLRSLGQAVPDDASAEDIAKAMEAGRKAHVMSHLKINMGDGASLASSYANWSLATPDLINEYDGKVLGKQLETKAKQIDIQRAGIETEALAAGVDKTLALAEKLGIAPDMVGNSVSPETQAKVQQAESALRALGNLETSVKEIVHDIDAGKLNPNTTEGNDALTRRLVALMQPLADIYGGASTEGGIQRALLDVGAPAHLAQAIKEGGWESGIRSWVSNKSINVREQIATAPKRAAESVRSVLSGVNSKDPDGVMRSYGYGHLLPEKPKEKLNPSVFTKKNESSEPIKFERRLNFGGAK